MTLHTQKMQIGVKKIGTCDESSGQQKRKGHIINIHYWTLSGKWKNES